MALEIVRTRAELRARVAEWHKAGLKVAVTPTMGALHAGHMSLVQLGRQKADRVVATIFVNPTQFGPTEDFSVYPRREAADAALLEQAGCDLLYTPSVGEIYPDGFATTVTISGVSEGACGAFRPVHFAGVATVVAKLLLQTQADIGIFGEKDWQQLQVIRRMVRDLDLPVEILGAPTLREADGLALSSRNAYLSPAERLIAPQLHRILTETAEFLRQGGTVAAAVAEAKARLGVAGFGPVDYLEVHDAETFALLSGVLSVPARLLVAAYLGKARLIDNIPV